MLRLWIRAVAFAGWLIWVDYVSTRDEAARSLQSTARALMQAGSEFGIAPYGVEALSVMRIEKGHVAGGELNGTTTAADLGLGRMMSSKKDYIGRMMAGREG